MAQELKAIDDWWYEKSEVDAVIAEKDAAIAELKNEINRKEGVGQRWFERCMEARTENVRLKRALCIARAALYVKEKYEKIIAEKDKQIEELKKNLTEV